MIHEIETTWGTDYRCDHSEAQMVRRRYSNGTIAVGEHCQDCNNWQARKKEGVNVADLPEYREIPYYETPLQQKRSQFYERKRSRQDSERQAAREAHDAEWWARYEAYLLTPQWKQKRDKVMRRSLGICESCDERKAAHVHHVTYQHLGNEPLWELKAVCRECHQRLHPEHYETTRKAS